jgi:hypothetical protein
VSGLDQGNQAPEYDFDVAASYAGQDRDNVLPIVRRLEELQVRVYDREDRAVENWGRNLVEHLPRIYRKRVRHGLLFVSRHYVTGVLAKIERQAAQSRAVELDGEFLLPIRLDDTELPGLLPTVQHLDLRLHSVEKICQAGGQVPGPLPPVCAAQRCHRARQRAERDPQPEHHADRTHHGRTRDLER